jgi:small subunit ribosomal protein S7
MPRKGEVPRRQILPDPKYTEHSLESRLRLSKFVNTVMIQGKMASAARIVYGAFYGFGAAPQKSDPMKVWEQALDNVQPRLEVKSRRVGGATYQVPIEVRPERAQTLAMRWIIQYARDRSDGQTTRDKLASEIMDAAASRGGAVKKREDTHKMAEANKAFAHYRW